MKNDIYPIKIYNFIIEKPYSDYHTVIISTYHQPAVNFIHAHGILIESRNLLKKVLGDHILSIDYFSDRIPDEVYFNITFHNSLVRMPYTPEGFDIFDRSFYEISVPTNSLNFILEFLYKSSLFYLNIINSIYKI